MRVRLAGSVLVFLLILKSLAADASAVTYNYIGSGGVSGTFTVDLAAGIPSQSLLPVSRTTHWASEAYGGEGIPNTSVPTSLVFSSTFNGPSLLFAPSEDLGTYSFVSSAVQGVIRPGLYDLVSSVSYQLGPNDVTTIIFDLFGSQPTWSSDGLPLLSEADVGTDILAYRTVGGVVTVNAQYEMVSIAPVPLPAPAWLFVSALGFLGVFRVARPDVRTIRRLIAL